jgi:hypothetical protein
VNEKGRKRKQKEGGGGRQGGVVELERYIYLIDLL